jgi:hypothetical protein
VHRAVLADDHRDLVYLAAAPVWFQRAAFAVLAKLGRVLARGAGGLAPEPA